MSTKALGTTPKTGGKIPNFGEIKRVTEGAGGGEQYILPKASASTLGGVKIGSGVNVAGDGTISVPEGSHYVLPVASAELLGGVKIGSGLNVSSDGTISTTGGGGGSGDQYVLPEATATILGGVRLGDTNNNIEWQYKSNGNRDFIRSTVGDLIYDTDTDSSTDVNEGIPVGLLYNKHSTPKSSGEHIYQKMFRFEDYTKFSTKNGLVGNIGISSLDIIDYSCAIMLKDLQLLSGSSCYYGENSKSEPLYYRVEIDQSGNVYFTQSAGVISENKNIFKITLIVRYLKSE